MPNYGDVAINLAPNWDRRLLGDKKYALWTVGHENGKSDAALKEEPEKRHQFAWVDPKYLDELAMNLSGGFEYVTKDRWNINEKLWQWNAENHVFNQGQILMARPAALWFEQQSARERELNSRKGVAEREDEQVRELAARAGIAITEDDDVPVRRVRK